MSGQLADDFKGAKEFSEVGDATDPSEVLPTADLMLLNTIGATQRLWHLHLTEKYMPGKSADDFKGAIYYGEEGDATDPSDALPIDDQTCLSTMGAI